jgi:hypothetical protein
MKHGAHTDNAPLPTRVILSGVERSGTKPKDLTYYPGAVITLQRFGIFRKIPPLRYASVEMTRAERFLGVLR